MYCVCIVLQAIVYNKYVKLKKIMSMIVKAVELFIKWIPHSHSVLPNSDSTETNLS